MQRNISGVERVLRLCLGLGICTAVLLLGQGTLADSVLLLLGFFFGAKRFNGPLLPLALAGH